MENPKITLRKSTEQAKATKNPDSKFWSTDFNFLVTSSDVLGITTLKNIPLVSKPVQTRVYLFF